MSELEIDEPKIRYSYGLFWSAECDEAINQFLISRGLYDRYFRDKSADFAPQYTVDFVPFCENDTRGVTVRQMNIYTVGYPAVSNDMNIIKSSQLVNAEKKYSLAVDDLARLMRHIIHDCSADVIPDVMSGWIVN